MGDEDDRETVGLQAAQHREEALDFLADERGSRLVEHQDFCVVRQGTGNLDDLLLGRRQLADERTRIEIKFEILLQQLTRAPVHLAVIDEWTDTRLISQEDRLRHGRGRNKQAILVNEVNAFRLDRGRRDLFEPLAENRYIATGPAVNSGQDLDDGRLAGAILSHDTMNGACLNDKIGLIKGLHRPEDLVDRTHFDGSSGHQILLAEHCCGWSPPRKGGSETECKTLSPSSGGSPWPSRPHFPW